MKKKIFFLIVCFIYNPKSIAQIFLQETIDKSIEITPSGIKGPTTLIPSSVTVLGAGIPILQRVDNTIVGTEAAGQGGYFLNSTILGYRAYYNSRNLSNGSTPHTVAVGSQSMLNYFASQNVAVGFEAMRGSSTLANNTGLRNVAVGYSALRQNSTGRENTALGAFSLYSNTVGNENVGIGGSALLLNTVGIQNVAIGVNTLRSNIGGDDNVAVGKNTLYSNIEGNSNTAVGFEAMSLTNSSFNTAVGVHAMRGSDIPANNTGGSNTAIGDNALQKNSTGSNNIAIGTNALLNNTTGIYNTALGSGLIGNTIGSNNVAAGSLALFANNANSGSTAIGTNAMLYADNRSTSERYTYNTAVGYEALRGSTTAANNTGRYNTAAGRQALRLVSSGNYNTAVGALAGDGITSGSYNIAIGYNADVPTGTADTQVRIGDANVSFACVQVAWTITSDRRWKEAIRPLSLSSDFVKQLRPVAYHRKNNETPDIETGLIAQELATTLHQAKIPALGLLKKNPDGMLSVRYTDLLMPLINALQEQQQQIEEWKTANEKGKQSNEQLTAKNEEVAAKIKKITALLEMIENNQK